MRPVKPSLVLIQDEIRKSFGWALEDDIESAENLANASVNPEPNISLQGTITVVGANAPSNFKPEGPTIVADGAVGAISDFSKVKLVVTDGDGFPFLQKAIDHGIPLCLHAHGDNKAEWQNVLGLIGTEYPILKTHQTRKEIKGMYNPGGFTDGDRAVCVALSLGAEKIELVGFSTQEVGPWSGNTDKKRKLIMLKWMMTVLNELGLEVFDEN